MRYAHILASLRSEPWFTTEATMQSIDRLLRSRLADPMPRRATCDAGEDDDGEDAPTSAPTAPVFAPSSIAVVRAHGILGKHLSDMAVECGGCDYDMLVASIRAAMSAPTVDTVIVHFHSPGGQAIGCAEAYDAIVAIRRDFPGKSLVAFVDSQCCSAAYYLAAACGIIVATRSAQLGCIGAMLTLEVRVGANEEAGIVRRTFKSATMKDIGNPDRERTPEEDAVIQARVDYLGGIFRSDMQSARPQIAAEVFETGLSYFAPDAARLGLVDEIVPSLESLL